MGLSLKELKEYLIAKEGYEITPQSRQLQDLKDLLDDMYRVRSENTCPSHVGTYYDGALSLGDMYNAGKDLKPCSCNTYKGTVCNCKNRTGTGSCICDVDKYCDCQNRVETIGCECYIKTSCSCVDRADGTCLAYATCTCRNRTGTTVCICDLRIGACTCYSRIGTNFCTCDGRCSCNVEKRFE